MRLCLKNKQTKQAIKNQPNKQKKPQKQNHRFTCMFFMSQHVSSYSSGEIFMCVSVSNNFVPYPHTL